MRQRQVARAERPELRQPRQIGADGKAVLHRQHHAQRPVVPRRHDIVGADRHPCGNAVLGPSHPADELQHGDGPLERRRLGLRGAPRLRHIGHEEPGRHAAAPHLRKIHSARGIGEYVRPGRPGNIDMGIDRHQRSVQRQRLRLLDVGRG